MRNMTAAYLPQLQGFRPLMRLLAARVFIVAAAGAALSAHAQGHHGAGRGGPGASGMMMFGGPPEHVGRSVDRMLDGLNATDAQRSQIKQIAMDASADLKTQRDAGRGMREKGMQIFTAPTIDAGAAEALRQQMSAQREQASKRTLQAMLDVAKVLTPEQRARIGERMKDRRAVMKDRMQRRHAPHTPHAPSQPAAQKPSQPAAQK